MTSIAQVGERMQVVIKENGEKAGRKSGFVKRKSKMGGAEFVETTVLGWMKNPQASLGELSQTAASMGLKISEQGLEQRFNREAAVCLNMVLEEAVKEVIQGPQVDSKVLKRFTAVYVQDSTVISLPAELGEEWKGCGKETGQAALKAEVRLDLLSGRMVGPILEDGRINDGGSQIQRLAIEPGALRIADLGYWSLAQMTEIETGGGYWLSRVKIYLKIITEEGKTWDLLDFLKGQPSNRIDCQVQLSNSLPTPARLLAVRVPQEVADLRRHRLHEDALRRQKPVSPRTLQLADWTILVTNVPPDLLSLSDALILARLRWQIELLFKLWKSHGRLDEWRSHKIWRILCEVYAKFIILLIQHWCFLISFWQFPNRSWVKATRTISNQAANLAVAFASLPDLVKALSIINDCLEAGCRISKRKNDPRAFQLLLALDLEALA